MCLQQKQFFTFSFLYFDHICEEIDFNLLTLRTQGVSGFSYITQVKVNNYFFKRVCECLIAHLLCKLHKLKSKMLHIEIETGEKNIILR